MVPVANQTVRTRPWRAIGLRVCLGIAFCLVLGACGGGGSGSGASSGSSGGGVAPPSPPLETETLSQADVQRVVEAAATAAPSDAIAIGVVDRLGRILAVYAGPSAPPKSLGNFGTMIPTADLAVALARTGAFFSNDQAPLSSRTVRFISGIHFPPDVVNTASAALYGIENTNRGCNLAAGLDAIVPPAFTIGGAMPGYGVITGKVDLQDSDQTAVNPGGVPIFKNTQLVGGIGVVAADPDTAEYIAYQAAGMKAMNGPNTMTDGVGFPLFPAPGIVSINGITLPFVDQTTPPSGVTAAGTFNPANLIVTPKASAGAAPEGFLIAAADGPVGGLTAAQVTQIINNAVATAMLTRAQIRLPIGVKSEMSIAVSDLDGTLIGLYRMPDGTVFSIDVAATKARNVIYFSGMNRQAADLNQVPLGTAVTNRTIGFGAQPFFPSGIDGTPPGPFFNLYMQDTETPCTQGFQVPSVAWPKANQSGVVFFPGSEPLYINGVLVGGLGVSGDGVDQDDYVTAGGAAGFEAPADIRADQIVIDGVRLPYLKFPRNPTD
jgi:uncharacterized protein GlcG (DUF336 family)